MSLSESQRHVTVVTTESGSGIMRRDLKKLIQRGKSVDSLPVFIIFYNSVVELSSVRKDFLKIKL